MFCALSGEAPEEPVVSKNSGHVFEKRLILKYIADNGRDPVSGEELTADDLLPIKLTNKFVKPRPPAASSIPNLLLSLQNEWDSVMLETYQLKQQYHNARQELSNALYENDAAKRVIARLIRERDEARTALASVQANFSTTPAAAQGVDRMDVDEQQEAGAEELDSLHRRMNKIAEDLSKRRKQRAIAPTCATPDQVSEYKQLGMIPNVHSVCIRAVDLFAGDFAGESREWTLTAGDDGRAVVTDWRNEGKVVANVAAHQQKINDAIWRNGTNAGSFFTASSDKTIKYFQIEQSDNDTFSIGRERCSLAVHSGEVNSVTLHPSGDYIVSASTDSTLAFSDVQTARALFRMSSDATKDGYTLAQYHPDGLIMGAGTNRGQIRLWDVKTRTNVRTFEGHIGKVTGIAFSENGYYLATSAAGEAVVKMWDLRKLTNFHTIEIEGAQGVGVNSVQFDYSGQFIGAACGPELRVFRAKKWDQLCSIDHHGIEISEIKFGPDAQYALIAGKDGKLVVAGLAE